ncbi:IS5 family transposase [Streptomyces sp. NPDC026659]|uniref:IS5 family transposase n=1 Tax=Streptomyces sp. NPDC026659 TaxID=3155123 RepID=UPI0033ECC968
MLSWGGLTDGEWAVLEPLLPRSNRRCGRWRDHRQVINGVIHRLSTGCQWRRLSDRFGPWQTIHKRQALWSADGTWKRLLQHVQAVADGAGDIDWNINVDSTSIRAHQHAAGAPANPPPALPGASKGGPQRSVHMACSCSWRTLSPVVAAGQRAGCTQFEPVMDKIRVPRLGAGRPRRLPDSVGADKAYSNSLIRSYLRRRGIRHSIPEKSDSRTACRRRGSDGGRPPSFDQARHKVRNTAERAINKIKQFRAVATRDDKRRYVYLGTVTTAALFVWLRS